jgi:hypothetical protein
MRVLRTLNIDNNAKQGIKLCSRRSKPYGLTFPEWIVKWWRWIFSIPFEKNPAIDVNGVNCSFNQHGPVWFLAGALADAKLIRNCTIPSPKAILFPVINSEISTAELPGATDFELLEAANSDIDKVDYMEVNINSIPIRNLHKFRIHTRPFDITIPVNNFMRLDYGPCKMVSDGYWIFLDVLPSGNHTLHFRGRDSDLCIDITFKIKIESG